MAAKPRMQPDVGDRSPTGEKVGVVITPSTANGASSPADTHQTQAGRRTTNRLIRSQTPAALRTPGSRGLILSGQKTRWPSNFKSAGVNVSDAASPIASAKAITGPALRTLANSANAIRPRPQMTVPALAAIAPPTARTLRRTDSAGGLPASSFSRYRLIR